ncbi:pentapeptide repeat-containing protein [Actinopolymorpha sp. NPDC004070]|uniref:pentapeptide repeat-containing protein n=1 Tax=Actinopolymorpha sp. NPDC004070 TaxID=3154548 RepID=UPI0033A64144
MPPPNRSGRPTRRLPARPRLPKTLTRALLPEHDLADEGHLRRLSYTDLDLAERDVTSCDVEECVFESVELRGGMLAKSSFADCRFDRCDLANLATTNSSLIRCELRGLRTTGLRWTDGTIRDVVFDQCRLDLSAFRFSTLTAVRFAGCRLTQADFTNADLRNARFDDCDLSGAQFAQADLTGARLRNCVLAGVRGVENLRGAVIDPDDLVALSYALAGALGIVIGTGDDDADPDDD